MRRLMPERELRTFKCHTFMNRCRKRKENTMATALVDVSFSFLNGFFRLYIFLYLIRLPSPLLPSSS